MKQQQSVTFALVIVGFTICTQHAWSWGRDGHQAVGKIAELRLNDKAKTALEDLTDLSLANDKIANWADSIAHVPSLVKGPGLLSHNNFWHYADIPYEVETYDQEREANEVAKRLKLSVNDIGKDNNVIEQIGRWRKVLADPTKQVSERKTALRFLVHFVGDIHQPLHCISRKNDGGGNAVDISYLGVINPHVHLHQVWDDNLVLELKGKQTTDVFAFALNQKVMPNSAMEWEKIISPKDWAEESHRLAKKFAYPPVIDQMWDENKQPVRLDIGYVNTCKPVVETQLMKAGVRLAKLLNDTLGSLPNP
jgi:S1/P1 Nuclease